MSIPIPQNCTARKSSRDSIPFARPAHWKWGGGIVLCFLIFCVCPSAFVCLEQALVYPWFFAKYGRGPTKDALQIQDGMTAEDVIRIAGRPHKKHEYADREAMWVYYFDSQENSYRDIIFDRQGRVRATMTED